MNKGIQDAARQSNDPTRPGGGNARGEKKVKIKVRADPGTDGRLVDWSYEADFENGGGSGNNRELKFDKGPGFYRMEFSLDDDTDFDLAFLEEPTEAMWVATGTHCPPPGPGDGGGEIDFELVPVGKKLTVINRNKNEGTLCYALRFSGMRQANPEKPGTFVPPYVFDPIMINGGGGGGPIM